MLVDSSRFAWRLALMLPVLALSVGPARWEQSQPAPAANTVLTIAGDVARPLTLTLADLKAMPRTTVKIQDRDRTMTFEGVLVSEILGRAGVPLGEDLRGAALASYVRATASDGYEVVFSIAELDPAMTSNEIIVADRLDGQPLSATQGPVRLVTPHDKRPSRGAHMLVRLDVVRLRK